MAGTVLITQGTRPFAHRVAKLLPAVQTVLFCAADELPEVLLGVGNYFKAPSTDTPNFVHEMLKLCLDNDVDTLIPLGKHELYAMAEARQLFSEYDIAIWVPEVADLTALPVIENPSRQLPLLLLHNGTAITPALYGGHFNTLSGVFTPSDSGDELALCCIAD